MLMRLQTVLLPFLLLTFSIGVQAQDASNGQKIYQAKKCFECHGHNGEGKKEEDAPRIAGQYDWYILISLNNFKSKKRANDKMLPYIEGLGEKDFKDLAAYLSKL